MASRSKPRGSWHHGDLRRALMAEMTSLVDERGVQAATLRDAARRLGVSEAAPYHHFRGKPELLAAIALDGYAALPEAMREAVSEAGDDPLRRHGALGRAYLRFAIANRGRYRVMFGEQMLEVAGHLAPEALAIAREAAAYPLAVAVEVAEAAGHPERGPAIHRSAWSLVHGAASLILEREIRFDDDGAGVDAFVDDVVTAAVAAARALASPPDAT